MEHLIMWFSGRLPYRVEQLGDRSMSFPIPKAKGLKTLQLRNKHPQYIVSKRKSTLEVLGIPPKLKQRGDQNNYCTFLNDLKKVLTQVPGHDLSKSSLLDLQKDSRIKNLYERYFKNNLELINQRSINPVTSSLLGYDNDASAVRDSIADVRKKETNSSLYDSVLTSYERKLIRSNPFAGF